MAHSENWARRLLNNLPKKPEEMLRRSYADATFLPMFFKWLDHRIYHDPQRAMSWARVAPDLALMTPEEDGPDGRRSHRERLIQAWVILGSAYRAAGRLTEANEPYEKAAKIAASEPISDLVRADMDRRRSTLLACQDRHDEALEIATELVERLRNLGKVPDLLLGQAVVAHGFILGHMRRYSESIAACGEALALAGDAKKPPEVRLHAAACSNLAMAITASGASLRDQSKALRYIHQGRKLLKGQVRTARRYQLQWAEGLVWDRTGSHAKAERLYRMALSGFETLKLPWHAALVGLDLGSLLHLVGDIYGLKSVAGTTYKRFSVLAGANTETLAALSQWVDSVRADKWEEEKHEKARRVILARVFSGRCCRSGLI